MSTKTKKDILSDEDFDPRNIKQRISIMLDLDLSKNIFSRHLPSGG